MKPATAFLTVSVAFNVVLIAAIALGSGKSSAPDAPPPQAIPAKAIVKAPELSAAAWNGIHGQDLAAERDQLREQGFPRKIVAAILSAEIHERFAERQKALEKSRADAPFWKPSTPDRETQLALRAISKEERQALFDLLGPDPFGGIAAGIRRSAPQLSDDKVAQLVAIIEKAGNQRTDLMASFASISGMTAEDRRKIDDIETRRKAEIAKALTPQEFEAYELATSQTADSLRYDLYGFNPSEQEFRAIYQLRQAVDSQFGSFYRPTTREERKAYDAAQEALKQQIATTLGPERYAEYQKVTDYDYRQTTLLVSRLELPPETTNQVYTLEKDLRQLF